MRDVAEKAGVSIKTVSRVVNDQGEISEATRQRVLAAIAELGYRPSRVARALVTQSSCTVGLVVADISNPFFPEVARGVLDTAQANDYNVFLCNTGGDLKQELNTLHSLADLGVDGVIIHPTYKSQANLKSFVEHYRPLVVVNFPFEHAGVSQIIVDNERGARLAVEYLIEQGHTNIGLLSGVPNPSSERVRRIQGYRQALMAHDLPVEEAWIVPVRTATVAGGYETSRQLLAQYPEVSAIFAYNDLLAIGALKACRNLGRRVPQDCAIIGFDDIQLAGLVTPTLTSVRVDKYNLGQQAMTRLLAMLENPTAEFPPVRLEVALTIRESA